MSPEIPETPSHLVVDEDPVLARIDWNRFAREFAASLSTHERAQFPVETFAQNAPVQARIGQQFPASTLNFLITNTTRGLWNWISTKENVELRQTALRGFQPTASKIKHPIVRSRLVAHFEKNRPQILAALWHYALQNPPLVAQFQNEPDDAQLRPRLPAIVREFGVDETLCALAFCTRETLLQDALNAPVFVDEAPHTFVDETPKSHSAAFDALSKTLAETQTALRELRAKFDSTLGALHKTQSENENLRAREKLQIDQGAKKFANLEARLSAEIDELRKREERQTRRLKSLERENEEFQLENRRLKKQLRHTQGLLEDERRKNAPEPPQSKSEENAPVETITRAPKKPVVATPLDEIFEWRADNRAVRVTAREVKRLIDRNDEDAVWQIMLALQALQQSEPEKRFKFLHRLKTIDAYYSRVLTSSTTRVLVDASNVARSVPNRFGKGQLVHLIHLREELRRRNCWPLIFIADASLPYNIDESGKLREMGRNGEIVFVDKGVEADEVLAREARKTGAYVVTNDTKFWLKVSPDFEPPRISFRADADIVLVDEF